MKGLLVRIDDYVQKAGAVEKELIKKMHKNPETILGKSIKELGKETYVSPATIVRLCKKLGCTGYKDFQTTLAYEIALFQESSKIAFEKITQKDTVDEIIYKVTIKNIESLENTSRISQLNVVDILFTAYVNKNYDFCMNQFRKTHIHKNGGTEHD
ncbi:MurR/RpiR family transcriptional regulator [Clostridium sp. E02]|uniref:MurR/RpiR family transcriptional regulator n=1 Tax=Clostridium sp. E02 TaxID=2487134 RepID=UPI000F52E432|nr:MurR/RpiR family transcriptional regulator [Clostridium sp. E02]